MADEPSVVIAWGAGRYTFHHRWQAAMFRFLARRWSGWTSWASLSDDEKATSVKARPGPMAIQARPRRRVTLELWNCWRTPRCERYADGSTSLFFGIGRLTWH